MWGGGTNIVKLTMRLDMLGKIKLACYNQVTTKLAFHSNETS